jgi:hypothetical protein
MNTNPVFTDYQGKPFPKARRRPRELRPWQRILCAFLIVGVAPLVIMGAVTQIDLTIQVKGVLPSGNGGTGTASTLTGVVRGGSAYTAAELSGDATTSGSNAVTVAKVNGTTVPTNAAANQLLLTTASATGAWATIPNCTAGALQYDNSAHTFACGTVLTGTFADAEVPSGTINGVNTTFTLAHTVSPAASLACYLNGVEQRAGGADYTLATATITYGTAPPTGSTIVCYYRF